MADLEALIRSLDVATIRDIIDSIIAKDMMILKQNRMPCDVRELYNIIKQDIPGLVDKYYFIHW